MTGLQELVSIVVEFPSRRSSSSGGDCLLGTYLQLGYAPTSNLAPSTNKPIKFRPPFSSRHRSLRLSSTLNTRYSALSRRFIRHMTSVLNLTALNTDSSGFVVRRCTQCSSGKSSKLTNVNGGGIGVEALYP
ncbi:MAG: hypothetical protein OXD31_10420 [Chloroflexi bacterium]|nr:hypothetical protein [Chloroflexota bacterium]